MISSSIIEQIINVSIDIPKTLLNIFPIINPKNPDAKVGKKGLYRLE